MEPNRNVERSSALLTKLAPTRPYAAILSDGGAEVVPLADVFDETTVDCFWREVLVYLATGEADGLREFAGVRVGGCELVSDPSVVSDWFYRRGRFAS